MLNPIDIIKLSLILLFLTACDQTSTAATQLAQTADPTAANLPTATAPAIPPTPTPAPGLPSPTPAGSTPAARPTASPLPAAASPTPFPPPDFSRGNWQLGQPMPPPARSEMPAVTLGDWIYVPGGFGAPEQLGRYTPQTDQWETLANMPAGRHHLMAAGYEGQLYIFGGAQAPGWTPTDTVWRYDPATNSWQELGPMPEARLAGAAVVLEDKIYIAGGAGGSEALLEFLPDQARWQSLPGPAQPREHVSAVAFKGEIWVIGGRWHGAGELATVEIFNPADNRWRNGPPLNVARAGFAAAVVGDYILAAGGEVIINGSETLASFEILAPGSSGWQLGPDLPVPIHGIGGAAFDNSLVLPGGSIRAGAIENEGHVQIYLPSD